MPHHLHENKLKLPFDYTVEGKNKHLHLHKTESHLFDLGDDQSTGSDISTLSD